MEFYEKKICKWFMEETGNGIRTIKIGCNNKKAIELNHKYNIDNIQDLEFIQSFDYCPFCSSELIIYDCTNMSSESAAEDEE